MLKNAYFFLTIILFLNLTSIYSEEKQKIEKPKFGHEIYKTDSHPKAIFEKLENGMRVILMPNQIPEKKVLVKLFIDAGSLNETDRQQGIANFLQQMAFQGTKNFSKVAIAEFIKKTNTTETKKNNYVDFDKSTFSFTLNDESLKNETLFLLADFAMNIQFSEEEIEKEKPNMLKGRADLITAEYRIKYEAFQFAFPGSIIAKRFPIGLEETIKNFKKEDLVDYYNNWYQPENITLIVVGDINTKEWSQAIQKEFKNFTARAPKKEAPIISEVSIKGLKTNYVYEKVIPDTKAEIRVVSFQDSKKISYQDLRKSAIASTAARAILKNRSIEKFGRKDLPFTACKIVLGSLFDDISFGNIWVACKPEDWKSSLTFIENELRKTIQYGFTEQELANFKEEYHKQLSNSITISKTLDSNSYMNQIANCVNKNIPFQSAAQNFIEENALLDALKLEEVNAEFKKYFAADHRLVSVSGNAQIANAKQEIKKVYEEASLLEVKKETNTPTTIKNETEKAPPEIK